MRPLLNGATLGGRLNVLDGSVRLKIALGLGVAMALVLAVWLFQTRRTGYSGSPRRMAASVASTPEPPAELPTDSTVLKSQLTDSHIALETRVATALRLKQLAGSGEAHLEAAKLDGALLNNAYFYSANLSGATFRGAKLRNINFFSATLRAADLSEADLFEADLRGTDLIGTNLDRANLTRAILFGADLSEATLSGTRFRGALLQGANLTTAKLASADLRGALYNGSRSGYPTRFPQDFDPKLSGMIECPGVDECSRALPDTSPHAVPAP